MNRTVRVASALVATAVVGVIALIKIGAWIYDHEAALEEEAERRRDAWF